MLDTFAERVKTLQTVTEYQHFMAEELGKLGFDYFAYLSFDTPYPQKSARVILNYPFEWIRRYAEQDYYRFDPILDEATWTLEAFNWVGLRDRGQMSEQQTRVMDEGGDFGLCEGMAIPIHKPDGGMAILSVSARMSRKAFEELSATHAMTVHAMALHYHVALSTAIERGDVSCQTLTMMEREVLVHSASERDEWTISEILHIPRVQVERHLRSAMKKLGVCSRQHAVVQAVANRLIEP
ncbi:helix-turn-helix transcriptional regulator [Ferruginivarius sediminum]|uniref:LuxR family transcriptional regulator n=1 Tax=Ferruginivarius sediminum TaxID=2661937 RepID=A0A369T8Q2_9PROT|nr:LuxR family transcriptional regulator [Ferruginivarius sediminum]RDD61709.1 LuxR family transcriptional regulator [Ferruginivarius sediminum]